MSALGLIVVVLGAMGVGAIVAGLLLSRRRADAVAPARSSRSPPAGSSTASASDASLPSIAGTPTTSHASVDSDCAAADAASVECGSAGGH